MTQKPLILIPAYQPDEAVLGGLLAELARLDIAGIVLVNDGSGPLYDDVFDRLAQSHGIKLLIHEDNQGKGAALRTGFAYIKRMNPGASHVATVDADGQHLPADVARVLDLAARHPESLVMGARTFKRDVPWRSLLGNRITYYLFRGLVGRDVADTQTGLRAVPVRLLDRIIPLGAGRYAYELQMLLTLIQDGVEIKEVPIETVYEDDNASSNFRPVQDSYLIYRTLAVWWMMHRFWELIKYGLSGLVSTLTDFAVYILLVNLSFGYVSASILARIVSVIIHFASNKYFTFSRRNRPDWKEIGKYLMVALFNLTASIFLIFLFTRYLSMGEVLAKIVAQCALFITSYALLNGFVFIRDKDRA